MEYKEFVELINMPAVLVILFCVSFMLFLGLFALTQRIRRMFKS